MDPQNSASSSDDSKTEKLSTEEILERDSEIALKEFRETGEMPSNLDPAVALITRQKKMARDNQGAFTKAQQKLIAAESRNKKLMSHALEVKPTLTVAQQEELDELKHTDPDKYIERVQTLNSAARQARETEINADLQKEDVEEQILLRKSILKQFKDTTGLDITDDVMENDVPPRITRKLTDGDISFEEYLAEAGRFLTRNKVIDKAEPSSTTEKASKKRFSDTGGTGSISDKQEDINVLEEYANGTLDI